MSGKTEASDSVAIHGRITIENSGEMRKALSDALRIKRAKMLVDLSDVSYIDTSGLATLVEAVRMARKQGTRLILSDIHDQPRYLFQITHLDQVFEITGEEPDK